MGGVNTKTNADIAHDSEMASRKRRSAWALVAVASLIVLAVLGAACSSASKSEALVDRYVEAAEGNPNVDGDAEEIRCTAETLLESLGEERFETAVTQWENYHKMSAAEADGSASEGSGAAALLAFMVAIDMDLNEFLDVGEPCLDDLPVSDPTPAQASLELVDHYWGGDYYYMVFDVASAGYCEVNLTNNGRRIGQWTNDTSPAGERTFDFFLPESLGRPEFDGYDIECR